MEKTDAEIKDLSEPLLSQGSKTKLEKGILQSYLNQKRPYAYPSEQPSHKISGEDDNDNKSEKEKQAEEEEEQDYINFPKENKQFWPDCTRPNANFYGQASVHHKLPNTDVMHTAILKHNPNIFAAFIQADPYMKEIELHEMMSMCDYKRLAKIRLRNYISILKMLTSIDDSEENYQEVKTKLYQVKALCKYLDLEQDTLYERLHKNQPIYDIEDEDESDKQSDKNESDKDSEEEKDPDAEDKDPDAEKSEKDGDQSAKKSKSDKASEKEEGSSKHESESEDDDDEEVPEEIEEEREFYQQTQFCEDWNRNDYSHLLLKEEAKWEVRAEYLEGLLEKYKQSSTKKGWVSWLQVKFDQLADLDIPIKKVSDMHSSEVFYLQQFIQDNIKTFNPKNEYDRDFQTQIPVNTDYPAFFLDPEKIDSKADAIYKNCDNLRQKLCFRIKKVESQTDYFVSVFERKPFGNEKIYEKRINTRGNKITPMSMKFHPHGGYLYTQFKVSKSEETYNIIDLIFPLNAQYKEPLYIKPNSHFLFFNDKQFYSYSQLVIKKDKSSPEKKKSPAKIWSKDNDDDENKEEKTSDKEDESESNEDHQEDKKEKDDEENEEDKKEDDAEKPEGEGDQDKEDKQSEHQSHHEDECEDAATLINRVYIYDLEDFKKFTFFDLNDKFTSIFKQVDPEQSIQELLTDKKIGKYKDGIYGIECEKEKEHYKIQIHLKDCSIAVDTIEKPSDIEPIITLNEKGDKLLVVIRKDDQITFSLFTLDETKKDKKFKKDRDLKVLQNNEFTFDKKDIEIKVEGMANDFIIYFQGTKTENTSFVYTNELFIDKVPTPQDHYLKFLHSEKAGLKHIYLYQNQSVGDDNSYACKNEVKYSKVEYSQESKKWEIKHIYHEILNNQIHISFPYAFFLYNHDQVFQKDLSKYGSKGFQYLNSFMGIEKGVRPITLYAHVYNSKHSLQILTINSNYTASEYLIKVHQIKTKNCQTHLHRFEGLVRYRIHAFTQDMASVFSEWVKGFYSPSGKPPAELKILIRANCLNFEKWESGKCDSRLIITNYFSRVKYSDRNVAGDSQTIDFKPYHSWCIVKQVKETIRVFTNIMRYNFRQSDIVSLDYIWDYNEDDNSNEIFQICIDTLIKDKVELYLIYTNGQMRKFTSEIPQSEIDDNLGAGLFFQEAPSLYTIDYLFKNNDNGAQVGKGASTAKKMNLYEQFKGKPDIVIANRMLYCHEGFIDFNSQKTQDKYIVGFKIEQSILKNEYSQILISPSETKIGVVCKGKDILNEDDKMKEYPSNVLFLFPLLNSRVIPQFHQRQFKHPIVPVVNKEKGYTSVFTLHLENSSHNDWSYFQEIISSFWQPIYRFKMMQFFNPGILIKYFNGIEEKIPMSNFGEFFSEIDRFQQSSDGRYVLILGKRLGTLKKDLFYDKNILNRDFHNGIFLYEIGNKNIELVKAFLFAEKNDKAIPEDLKTKFKNPAKQKRTYVKPELEHQDTKGEYDEYYITNDGRNEFENYIGRINIMEESEEHVEDAERAKKLKQEQEKKKKIEEMKKKGEHKMIDDLDEEPEQQEEKPKITKIENILELFQGFDIPYPQNIEEHQQALLDSQREQLMILEEDNEDYQKIASADENGENQGEDQYFEFEEDKLTTSKFTSEEIEKISKVHCNMHIFLNKEGQIFLINRLANKLYFFYKCDTEFKVAKLRFEAEFRIEFADADKNHLLVRDESENFRILDIKDMMECLDHNKTFQTSDLKVIYDSAKVDKTGVKKELVGMDEVNYKIKNCWLRAPYVILQCEDDKDSEVIVNTIRVFDYENKHLKNYIEGDRFIVSGCRQYLWVMKNDQVYDIKNDLSTLFLWPGDQVNMTHHDPMDRFNISEDRTMMSTHGQLQLTFNYISILIDQDMEFVKGGFELRGEKGKKKIINQIKNFDYLYYKISDYKSLLEQIFMEEWDKTSKEAYQKEIEAENQDNQNNDDNDSYGEENSGDDDNNDNNDNEEEKEEQKQDEENKQVELTEDQKKENKEKQESQFMKNLSMLLGQISNTFDIEKDCVANITNYFFSFYHIDKVEKRGGTEKEPVIMNIFERLYYGNTKTKRIDLIEDILHYVVKQKEIPITQQIIMKCFVNFLESVNSNVPFQDFLKELIIVKTQQMEDIEKFQINIPECGFYIKDHESPMIDNKFISKSKEKDATKSDVNISSIYIGNLLLDQGKEIMTMLCDNKYLGIMDIPFIQYLVMFQWQNFKGSIKRRLLYPFYSLLFLYSFYTLYVVHYNYSTEVEDSQSVFYTIIRYIVGIMVTLDLVYFLGMELMQLISQPGEYFQSPWNFADIISYSLCLTVLFLNIIPADGAEDPIFAARRIFATLSSIILWIKLFYFLRIYETTSKLIRMIIEICNDMKNFLIVLLICIVGFTNGFYILQQGAKKEDGSTDMFVGDNPFKAFIYTYRLAQGDFQLDGFDNLSYAENLLAWIIFVFGTLFVVIVILNLLIAIMGDTFSKVSENITNLSTRETVMMISENESLFDRKKIFANSQYLIIIEEKNLESSKGENWDGQVTALKKTLLGKISSMETGLDTKITENQKDLKKRLMDQDERSKKAAIAAEGKMTTITQTSVRTELTTVATKLNELLSTQQQQINSISESLAAVSSSVSGLKNLQEKVDYMQSQQATFNKGVAKALGIEDDLEDEEDEY